MSSTCLRRKPYVPTPTPISTTRRGRIACANAITAGMCSGVLIGMAGPFVVEEEDALGRIRHDAGAEVIAVARFEDERLLHPVLRHRPHVRIDVDADGR